MIQSMTGYGRSSFSFEEKNITIEIKTLNSKQLEVNCRFSSQYRSKELELRNKLNALVRGKIDLYLYEETNAANAATSINKNAILSYYHTLSEIADELKADKSQLFSVVSRFPEVLGTTSEELSEEFWQVIFSRLQETMKEVEAFRMQEGSIMAKDIRYRIQLIQETLNTLDAYEKERIEQIKAKLSKYLSELDSSSIDPNRFEQELIYYLEKLDITEEKVRLQKHLDYFIHTMDETESQGKKLGFIAQEIGREINTIGSKSNHAEMQKKVVEMKDELEKIKEQLGNIL